MAEVPWCQDAGLWQRRTTLDDNAGMRIELLSLPDLVCAKKTQWDEGWPMLRRLVEANYFGNRDNPAPAQVAFWLRESRTAAMLLDLARQYRLAVASLVEERPLLGIALDGNGAGLATALVEEEMAIRDVDRAYWLPLKAELERLRHRL